MEEFKLGRYEHFKGKMCEVIGFARDSETLEEVVVYRELGESKEFGLNSLWVRPKDMFFGTVNLNGKIINRFRFIE